MEDNLHGACIYTATAFGKGSVICRNRFAIKCYDLAAGNTSQAKRRSFVIELGRLLIIWYEHLDINCLHDILHASSSISRML
jgi:hypothetical protein